MSKRIAAIAAAFFLAMILLRLLYVRRGEIIYDEFQHLHAAYLVAGGQTPYVDFFEHHTPAFYYLAAPLLRLSALDFDTILSMRYLSLAAGLLAILIAAWWARRLRGNVAAVLVGAVGLADMFLFSRGSILFLDVFAAPLLMLSAILLSESRGRFRATFASGLAMGAAILFTQKAVMAGFAVALVFFARWLRRNDAGGGSESGIGLRGWCREISGFAAGGAAAALALPAMLGLGGLEAFWRDNVVLNMAWKARHFPTREIAALAGTGGTVYLIALVGLAVRLRGLWQRRFCVLPEDVPALFLASLGLGIVFLPVVWSEYFITAVNFATLVAGLFLFDLGRQGTADSPSAPTLPDGLEGRPTRIGWPAAVWLLVAACAVVSLVDLFGRWLVSYHPLSTAALVAVLVLWGVIGGTLVGLRRARNPAWMVAAVALLLVFPVVEQADFLWQEPNDAQRARVAFVLAHTRPDEPVFDGYSGYGLFRPHAYRYWFLHEEVQQMLSREELEHGVIDALERSRRRLPSATAGPSNCPTRCRITFRGRTCRRSFRTSSSATIRRKRGWSSRGCLLPWAKP